LVGSEERERERERESPISLLAYLRRERESGQFIGVSTTWPLIERRERERERKREREGVWNEILSLE
jgi:hypothetical protein